MANLTNGSEMSDRSIEEILIAKRAALEAEAGLHQRPEHFKRPQERQFTAAQRPHTTLLIGGLTLRHDTLIKAGWEGLGYRIKLIPTPRKADFQAGKEYGNNGQCNPTYFTVGALVNYLKELRDQQGLSTEEIVDNYVFLTAGACGPCRFGMYEAEFRLALRNSGFDGFRVLLFQQSGGLEQGSDGGLKMDLEFFLSMLNAMLMGDLLNEVGYHVRPYETEAGMTDRALQKCMAVCEETLRDKDYAKAASGMSRLLSRVGPVKLADAEKFFEQLLGNYYVDCFRRCAQIIDREVQVDYTRNKPIVKVTGEFWAQTTEGDGNFNMFPFLEREGAEVLVEPIITWINYMLHQARVFATDSRGLNEGGEPIGKWEVWLRLKKELGYRKTRLLLVVAEKILLREFDRLRVAIGSTAHRPVNQLQLQRLGHPFYNSRSGGGEGHLEVAKNIYYSAHGLAHMVLSLKPFGCMPSTQSDGAQAAVVSQFSDMIYLPIETSGEGDINAHSRVQMALGEAKVKAKAELKDVLQQHEVSLEQVKAYVAKHPELRRPLQELPHPKGTVSRASRFVAKVAPLAKAEAKQSRPRRAGAAAGPRAVSGQPVAAAMMRK